MNLREFNPFIPMADFFLIVMMAAFVLFLSIVTQVNPAAQKKDKEATVGTDGVFVVIMEWPADSNDDIDLYVMNAEQDIVFFGNPSVGLMHLERDDYGRKGDSLRTRSGATVTVEKNEERTVIRGIVPGEYVVNVHAFAKRDRNQDTPVKVSLYRLKGEDVALVEREVILTRHGEEATAFRMTIDEGQAVTNVNELPRRFVGRAEEAPQ